MDTKSSAGPPSSRGQNSKVAIRWKADGRLAAYFSAPRQHNLDSFARPEVVKTERVGLPVRWTRELQTEQRVAVRVGATGHEQLKRNLVGTGGPDFYQVAKHNASGRRAADGRSLARPGPVG